jgi:hypothetical protein
MPHNFKQTDDDNDQEDAKLAAKIIDAIKQVDDATATRNEKAVAAGKLLVEAHKRHPTDKAFEKFLLLAGGVGIRRAKDLIAFALERKDFEQHQIENAAAQQRYRDKLKAEKIERQKAKAALPKPEPKPKPDALRNASPEPKPKPDDASKWSADNLREFEYVCRIYLPRLNESDLVKARQFILSDYWRSKQGRAA